MAKDKISCIFEDLKSLKSSLTFCNLFLKSRYNPFRAKLSQNPFWLNFRQLSTSGAGEQWETYSSLHLFDKYDKTNGFRGLQPGTLNPITTSNKQMVTVCNKDDVDNGVCNNDELFDSDKNARQTFNPVEKNDYNNYPFSREAIDNTLNSQSLNMQYLENYFSTHAHDEQCLRLQCTTSEATVVQDKCAQDNTRPLCVNKMTYSYTTPQCPAKLNGVNYCGKNVRRMSYLTIYNGLEFADSHSHHTGCFY